MAKALATGVAAPLLLVLAVAAQPRAAEAQTAAPASAAGIRHHALGFEALPGGPGKRIILKPDMISRLGIETAAFDAGQKTLPARAIFYDAKGKAWIYVSGKPGVFTGQKVDIERVEGDRVVLGQGVETGTPVVMKGVGALNGGGMFGR